MADPATIAVVAAGFFSLFAFSHPRHHDVVLNVKGTFAAHSANEEIHISDDAAGFHRNSVLKYVNLAIGFAGPLPPDGIPLVKLAGSDNRYDTFLPLQPQGTVSPSYNPFQPGVRTMLVYSGPIWIKAKKGSKLDVEFTRNAAAEASSMDYEITLIGGR